MSTMTLDTSGKVKVFDPMFNDLNPYGWKNLSEVQQARVAAHLKARGLSFKELDGEVLAELLKG